MFPCLANLALKKTERKWETTPRTIATSASQNRPVTRLFKSTDAEVSLSVGKIFKERIWRYTAYRTSMTRPANDNGVRILVNIVASLFKLSTIWASLDREPIPAVTDIPGVSNSP